MLVALATWQLCCRLLIVLYRPTFGRIVEASYSAWVGDIQANYGLYARLTAYLVIVLVTTPATLLSLRLLHWLCRSPGGWMCTGLTFAAWQAVVVPALIWSYEVGLAVKISDLRWELFGPPAEIYSFSNLVLPRLIAWLVCTVPVACAGLWLERHWMRTRGRG
jgi:hypothetical protein